MSSSADCSATAPPSTRCSMTSPTATSRSGASVSISGTASSGWRPSSLATRTEHLLRATLLSAEQAANVVKEKGRMEARMGSSRKARGARDHPPGSPTASRCCSMRRIRLLLHAALDAMHEMPEDEIREDPPAIEEWVRRLRRGRKSADGRYLYWLGNGERGHTQAAGGPGSGPERDRGPLRRRVESRIGAARARPGERDCSTCSPNASASDGRSSPSSRGSPRGPRRRAARPVRARGGAPVGGLRLR